MSDDGRPKQHIEAYRKLAIRRDLLRSALPGPVYVPFCGDGDIAAELYADRPIFAADLDPERVAVAASRLPDTATVLAGDCDAAFPFSETPEPFAVADFDAWVHPYAAFKQFWRTAPRTDRVVLFFTDGHRQGIKRSSLLVTPDGEQRKLGKDEFRAIYNFYWAQTVLPWLTAAVAPSVISQEIHYLRAGTMVYYGLVVDSPDYAGAAPAAVSAETRTEKFGTVKKAAYLDLLRQGESRLIAARKAGIEPRTVTRHAMKYPAFATARDEAEMEASGEIENALFMAAKSGNVVAIQVWLYNRMPERWADKRQFQHEISGPAGGPIETAATVITDGDAAEIAAQLMERLSVRRAPVLLNPGRDDSA